MYRPPHSVSFGQSEIEERPPCSRNKDYLRIQVITIQALLAGKKIEYPPTNITFKDAPRTEQGTKKAELEL